ncbi:MAG: dTMP kinase [Ardenticatenaceae bacterium]
MYFITFEGPDGSGKTTQIGEVAAWFRARGYEVVRTREPGGTAIGDQIRQVLMEMGNQALVPSAEFLLFSASRAQHVRELIRPALAEGKIVLCDRFADSSLAYQGYGHGLPLEQLHMITAFATDGLVPDLTLLLDIDVAVALQRRRKAVAVEGAEWTRIDDYKLAFHRRIRQGYHKLAAAEPQRWRLVNAAQPVAAVQQTIRKELNTFLRQKTPKTEQ